MQNCRWSSVISNPGEDKMLKSKTLCGSPVVTQTLRVNNAARRTRRSLLWGSINAVVLSILIYDIWYTCPVYTTLVLGVECAAAFILLLNTLYHFMYYLWGSYFIEPIVLTPNQKRLLGIRDSDPHFKTPDTSIDEANSSHSSRSDILTSTPMNLSALSWRSSLLSTPNECMTSPNYSVSSPSWVYYQGSPSNNTSAIRNKSLQQQTPNASPNVSQLSNISSVEFIDDENSLSQYLQDYENYEKTAVVGQSIEQPTNLLSSFWSHPIARTAAEAVPLLRRCTYQLAPPSPTSVTGGATNQVDEIGSPSSFYPAHDVWRRVKVNPNVLTQWNANLRMWLSRTVLERLVKEIDVVDETMQRHGLPDIKIGYVGLERLKKTAQIANVKQNIPTLMTVIPFLELSVNQEYLVTRIRELAKGGCMSEFRWNGGGSFHGKSWEEHLPTDSAIVMHLFATYLDSQLPPLPHNPDVRPFTTQHFVKTPEKPVKGKNALVIYQVQINPPHFIVLDGDETLEVAKGRNNMFHTVLLFLHQVNTKESGMLGRMNLGPSGLNLLWVIST